MNRVSRVEELAAIALDEERTLSEEEWFELETLLSEEQNWEVYRRLLDTEALLRGMDRKTDLADRVLDQIEKEEKAVILRFPGVVKPIVWAAAAVLVIGFSYWVSQRSSVAELPLLTSREGSVEMLDDGESLLVSVARDGRAVWTYEDRTVIEAQAGTELVLGADLTETSSKSKRFELRSGTLVADVAKQESGHPLLVETPHARAIVRGTRFKLSISDGTRLVVTEGQVDLVGKAGEVLPIRAGEVGFAGPEGLRKQDPRIAVEPLVFYTFEAGKGNAVRNRSGLGESFDLYPIEPDQGVDWRENGIFLDGNSFLVSGSKAGAIVNRCQGSGEVTFEAWLTPAVAAQGGPARIVTLTRGSTPNAIMLAQGAYQLEPAAGFLGRTPTDAPGGDRRRPLEVGTSPVELTHIVFTHASNGDRRMFLNGEEVAADRLEGGFENWPREFPLSVGGDLEGENRGGHSRSWNGTMHFLAIFDRALSEDEVQQNFLAGSRHFHSDVRIEP